MNEEIRAETTREGKRREKREEHREGIRIFSPAIPIVLRAYFRVFNPLLNPISTISRLVNLGQGIDGMGSGHW